MSAELATVAAATWRDEKTLERATHAVRKLRALAHAIENDPDLAPLSADIWNCYAPSGNEKPFLAAARRLLPEVIPQVDPTDNYYVVVAGELDGEPVKFRCAASAVGTKRTVTRQVEEWTLDEVAS